MSLFNPPGERRLFFLWAILSVAFFWLYYIWPRPVLVQRFEKAYFTFFWNRPITTSPDSSVAVGVIAPRHVSSLVDTELWVWVEYKRMPPTATATPTPAATLATGTAAIVVEQNQTPSATPTETVSPTATAPPKLETRSPVLVIDYLFDVTITATPTPTGTLTPTPPPTPTATPFPSATPAARAADSEPTQPPTPPPTETPTPTATPPIVGQLLFRQGENRTDLNTDSRTSLIFEGLFPGETAARVLWMRVMPVAERLDAQRGRQVIYLADENPRGHVIISYYFWPDGQTAARAGQSSGHFTAEINTRQAVLRGFVRTLLLPPWANGLVVGMALLGATLLNALSNLLEQRLFERQQTEPRLPDSLWQRFHYLLRVHPFVLLLQGIYWLFALAAVVGLVLLLAERGVLCPLLEGARAAGVTWNTDSCVLEPQLGGYIAGAALLAVPFYFLAYLLRDETHGSVGHTLQRWGHNLLAWLKKMVHKADPARKPKPPEQIAAEQQGAQRRTLDSSLAQAQAWRDQAAAAAQAHRQRYDTLRARFEDDAPGARMGEEPAYTRLNELAEEVYQHAAELDAPPTRRLAAELKRQLDACRKDYAARFIEPLRLANEHDLPTATTTLRHLGPDEMVRFFLSADLRDTTDRLMTVTAALDVAEKRMAHADRSVRRQIDDAKDRLTQLIDPATSGPPDAEARQRLQALKAEVAPWPDALRRRRESSPAGRAAADNAVSKLKEAIDAALDSGADGAEGE